jgi:hypothetical protein
VIAGIAVIRDSVCAHAPTPACGHGFKVVPGELCTGRVMLQTRIFVGGYLKDTSPVGKDVDFVTTSIQYLF